MKVTLDAEGKGRAGVQSSVSWQNPEFLIFIEKILHVRPHETITELVLSPDRLMALIDIRRGDDSCSPRN